MSTNSETGLSYPEDNCLTCYANAYYGANGMYFCRHDSSGLVWGQCCKKESSSSHECKEMYDSDGLDQTRCSDQSPLSTGMKYYYCLAKKDSDGNLGACGLPGPSYTLKATLVNDTISVTGIPQSAGNTCYYDFVAEGSWIEGSKMHIYPGEMTNVDVYIANGTSRLMA